MDDKRLSELFASAVRDAPPASFDERDVATASRALAARRRTQALGGSGFAVIVLATGLFFAFGSPSTTTSGEAASAGVAATAPHTFGRNAAPGLAEPGSAKPVFPGIAPKQGGTTTGKVGPNADSTPHGCGPTDRELAVALANELPSVGAEPVRPTDAVQVPLTCEPTTRAAGYVVHQGAATGQVIALLGPETGPLATPPTSKGTVVANAQVSGGRLLTLYSEPLPGSPAAPVAARLRDLAARLAGMF